MSIMLAPAPAVPETPTFTPADDAPSFDHRDTFGPRLSEARDRLARADADDRSPDRPARADESGRRSGPDRRGPSEETDRAVDVHEDSDRPAAGEDEVEVETETAGDDATGTTPASRADVPTNSAAAISTITILPTAKGAEGASDPSTPDSVEEVAAPISEGDTLVEEATLTQVVGTEGEAELGPTTDRLRSAEATVPTPMELEQTVSDDGETAARLQSSEAPSESTPTMGRLDRDLGATKPIAPTAQAGPDAATQVTDEPSDVVVDPTQAEPVEVEVDVASAPAAESEVAEAVVPKSLVNNAAASEASEPVAVRAREAAATDVAKAAAAPTQGQLDGPEGSLWEDVRSAFDRIRSNGETNEVRIRLRPAELGELVVQVRTQGEHVAVRLLASSAAAQQALLDDRLRLASELALAGFEEGSVDIDRQSSGETGSQDDRQPNDGEQRPSARSIDMIGPDHAGAVRERFERRDPIHTEAGFRPGRHAYSTINLTL